MKMVSTTLFDNKNLLDDYKANDFEARALIVKLIRNVHEKCKKQACSATCKNTYNDSINLSLTFLKNQYLYTMHWAMFVFYIIYVDNYMLHSASQTYLACVILSINIVYR